MVQTISSEVDTQWDSTSRMDPIGRPRKVTWAKPQSMARCSLAYPTQGNQQVVSMRLHRLFMIFIGTTSLAISSKNPFEAASLLPMVKKLAPRPTAPALFVPPRQVPCNRTSGARYGQGLEKTYSGRKIGPQF